MDRRKPGNSGHFPLALLHVPSYLRHFFSSELAKVEICNLVGQRVSSSLMPESQTEVDLESLHVNSGVYLVKVTAGNVNSCIIYQKD